MFEVWTAPKHVRRWWGREEAPVVVCDIDLRVGGTWRYVTRAADGAELGWHGTYQEITAPNRLVSTEVFEGMYNGILAYDEALRSSGHYGARVDVPEDADVQTKLIAFTGRTP